MSGVGTTHHVEIGGHYYLVRPGSYLKKQAPMFGARFTTGDPDYNNLSMWQHLVQKNFIGGVDQDVFADNAMYDQGVGVDTTEENQATLARGLVVGAGSNWALGTASANGNKGHKSIIFNDKLYVLSLPTATNEGQLWEYDSSTDGWVRNTALDAANISPASIAAFDGKLYIGGVTVSTTTATLHYGTTDALTTWTAITPPAGVPAGAIYAMGEFQQRFYVAYGAQVWRLKQDQTWDGATVFYDAKMNSSTNHMVAMEPHLGFLYMLSQNGHIHRTDGNATFDIWSWGGQTHGVSIKSFDGKLFILTFEFSDTTDAGWGVLYQMSGSAMTQLKRWGRDDTAMLIGNMVVYDRRLWYGATNLLGFGTRSGFGVACYDPIEDAHSIPVSRSDTVTFAPGALPSPNYIVDDQIFFKGKLFVFVRGYGVLFTPYQYRDLPRGLRSFDTSGVGGFTAKDIDVGEGNTGVAYSATSDRYYVALFDVDQVKVVDPATDLIVATVAVGNFPTGLAWCSSTNRVYVCNQLDDTVSVIDCVTNTVVATVAVGDAPLFVVHAPVNDRMYVSNSGAGTVSVIDPSTNTVVATITVGAGPRGVGYHSGQDRVVVANGTDDTISVINPSTNTVVSTVAVGDNPHSVAYAVTNDKLFVSNLTAGTVSVLNNVFSVTATLAAPTGPQGMVWASDENLVYVSGSSAGVVTVIDPVTSTVVATIPGRSFSGGMAYDTTRDLVYVASASDDFVMVIDPSLSGGWFSTSGYDAGTPGLRKLWRKFSVDAATPTGTGITVQYSLDDGSNWVTVGVVDAQGNRAKFEFFLENKISTSLQLRFILHSDSTSVTPVFYGVAVSYLPLPEPNWMWSMVLVLAAQPVLLDGTAPALDTEAEIAFLSALHRTKALTTFTDAEGVQYASGGSPGVLIYDITFALRDLTQPLEGEVSITLLEAVEAYE